MDIKLIPGSWETKRLIVKDSNLEEVEELQAIDDIVPQTRGWSRKEGEELAENPILATLKEGALPPNGRGERFRMQSIRTRDTHRLIGFLTVYHGFPSEEVLWITTLTLHPDDQGKGYGGELINELVEVVGDLGSYSKIQTFVPLLNWPSLRLCMKVGFNKMVRIEGDKVYSKDGEAHVLLEKNIFEV